MKYLRVSKILDLLVEICYLSIVFFVPVYFALFLKNANVFELNKIILFKVLVLLLLLLTLITIIIRRNAKFYVSTLFNKYLIIPLLFLLVLTLSAIFSIDPWASFYGLYDRQQGLISYLYYLLFFVLLLGNIKTKKQIIRIIIAAVLASFFVCVYGLVQAAGFDPLDWIESTSFRITSTFGQPNFLALYLLLVIPLSAYLFFISKRTIVKYLTLFVLFLQLLCLFFTYSRGAWLGLILSLIIFAFLYLIYFKKERIKINFRYLKWSLFFSFLFLAIILYLFNTNFLFQFQIKNLLNVHSGSVAARINYWQASWDAIKKKPFLGYGPENQGEVLVQYYQKDWAVYSRVDSYPNRAHNLIIDNLLTSGLVGLISYLLLLCLFFRLCFRNIKESRDKWLSLAIAFGVAGYLISLMFGFSVVTTDIYFWLLLATIFVLNSQNRFVQTEKKNQRVEYQQPECKLISNLIKMILIVTLSTGVFYQITKEVKKLIADYYFRELQLAYINNEHFKTYVLYDYIKEIGTKEKYYDRYFGQKLADRIDKFNQLVLIKPGEIILENILVKLNDNSYQDIFAKAQIYTALANEDKEYYDLAQANFKKVIEISPEMPRNYFALGGANDKKGDYEQAINYYKKSLAMLPDLNDIYLNQYQHLYHKESVKYEYYLIYKKLGSIYYKQNLYNESEKFYNLAYINNPSDLSILKSLANISYLKGDLEKAIEFNKRGYSRDPSSYIWPYSITLLYYQEGYIAKALEYGNQALQLEPDNKRIIQFVKEIKQKLE